MAEEKDYTDFWRDVLTDRHSRLHRERQFFRLFPAAPRCKMCNAPFGGVGGRLFDALLHMRPSSMNPNYCNACDNFARTHPGGAEIELAMLFADVRGSTALAEKMSVQEFARLMERFYSEATRVIANSDGMIEKFVGDEVAAMYVPGMLGAGYVRTAVEAARELLRRTGHDKPEGPWLPVGVGVHVGTAFVGSVGREGVFQIAMLGDAVNVTARLASSARAGEVLISDAAREAAGLDVGALERRTLELKGKAEPFGVHVLTVTPNSK